MFLPHLTAKFALFYSASIYPTIRTQKVVLLGLH